MDEDKAKLVIRMESSSESAAGAVASYLLRRLAARAGAYAPGIQENVFYEIAQNANGSSLDKVGRWIEVQSGRLSVLGYQILARRVAAPATEIMPWVEEGGGYRAAILAVDGTKLYGSTAVSASHAVALMWSDPTAGLDDRDLETGLVMVDAWPALPTFKRPPKTLDLAHRSYKHAALLLFWTGHS